MGKVWGWPSLTQTVTVGRENMFWMRFDVDREDDYYFYMVFLKSQIDGGLVSVMMRIDGDKIFQVNLGGASGRPIMDMELVEGPRHLRSGPHSFGIRFSGTGLASDSSFKMTFTLETERARKGGE